VKHGLILLEQTWRKWLQFSPPHRDTAATLLCEIHRS